MKRMMSVVWVGLALMCAGQMTYALSPTATIQKISDGMIKSLKQNKGRLKQPGVIRGIVNKQLLPYVDMTSMSGRVVGRKAWLKASPSARSVFEQRFKQVLVNTYSNALLSFDNDTLKVYPSRVKPKQTARVRSAIIRRNGQRISMIYNMRKKASGWRIYDVSIENVSIVDNYKAQYARVIQQGGLSLLNNRLARR